MTAHRSLGIASLAIALAACGVFGHKSAVEIQKATVPVGQRWNASLATPSDLQGALQVKGDAYMARGDSPNSTKAVIHISNAAPGGQHPWHVHVGQCGDNGPIFGAASDYPILHVDKDGTAEATANISQNYPTSGQYYINVHASVNNMGTIISCGNLAPPIQ